MQMVIFIGLPGSGKSTFYEKHFAQSHTHISKDQMPNTKNRAKRQMVLLEEALLGGESVVIDNTNPRLIDRQILIDAARKGGAQVTGYFFDVPVATCIARNEQRVGKGRVPKVAIFTAAKHLVRPNRGEGFDELFRVWFADGGIEHIEPI